MHRPPGDNERGWKHRRVFLRLCYALALSINCVAITQPAGAAFLGDYALSNWTFTNTNADGSVMTPDGGLSIILTGGNNGTGLPGTSDFVIAATQAGTIQFQWSYSSLDMPGFDDAGYLLGGIFTLFADTDGQSGTAMFSVNAGDVFGFRIETMDNQGEPGILTVSDFSAPGANIPEPGPALMMLMFLVVAVPTAAQRHMSRNKLRRKAA